MSLLTDGTRYEKGEEVYDATIVLADGTRKEVHMPASLYRSELEPKFAEIQNKTVRELKGREIMKVIEKYGINTQVVCEVSE